jgi:hypothetical protein
MTLEEKLSSVLETYGEGFVKKLKDKLKQIVQPEASGRGANSLISDVEGTSLNIMGFGYLSALDTGTSKYKDFPSPRNIESWINSKGIKSTNGYSIKKLSFAISRSIYEKGTKPRDFLDIVFREDRVRLENMLLDGITEHIDIVITKPFAEQTKRTQ